MLGREPVGSPANPTSNVILDIRLNGGGNSFLYPPLIKTLIEFESINASLSENRVWDAKHTLKRVRTIMKTLVGQMDILETMTPMSFTSFRDRLDTASGFQSAQFRELEFVLGYKRPEMLKHYEGDAPHFPDLNRRLAERSVVDHFHDFLVQRGVAVPEELRNRDVAEPTAPNRQVQESLLHLYRTQPEVSILLELMTDFDEGLQEWRYRHVKMVERTIGRKRGTGGSPGVEYLRESLFKPIFPDLWAIRHEL